MVLEEPAEGPPQQLPALLLEFRGHRAFSARQAAQLVAQGVNWSDRAGTSVGHRPVVAEAPGQTLSPLSDGG